ncbi:MAG: HlyD family efflux transporter periplasmic adaptor subunit [Ignavibacteriales bacterium]
MKKRVAVKRVRRRTRREPAPLALFLAGATIVLLGSITWARGTILPLLVRTRVVDSGAIEKSFEAEAVLIRKESVYVAGISGKIHLLVQEGERVRTGSPVVEISNPQARKAAEERLAEIDARVAEFERDNRARYESLRGQAGQYESSVTALARSAQNAYSLQDTAGVAAAEADLSSALEKRATALAEIEALDSAKSDLESERDGVKALLSRAVTVMESQSPGIVSFSLSGCEKEFSTSRLNDISARSVFMAKPEPHAVADGEEAAAGDPIFRVVQTDEWYVAAAFPSNRAPELSGANVRIRLAETGDRLYSVRVARLDTGPPGGQAVMVLQADSLPGELMAVRKTRAVVVTSSTQGVIVPKSALTTRGGDTGVFVVYKTMAQFKPVQVKAQDGDSIVVEGILPGTEVVTNPWLVKEGRRVK